MADQGGVRLMYKRGLQSGSSSCFGGEWWLLRQPMLPHGRMQSAQP